MMRTKIIIFIITVSLLTNGFLFYKVSKVDNLQSDEQEEFPFLSKRIFAENQNNMIINFFPLRLDLKEYVEKLNGKVGVYFEYLPSGISIGVNEKKEVKVVSLSKVSIVMSILKKIERGKISLEDIVSVRKENIDNGFGTLWKRGEGANVSIKELIELSLTESDNTAYKTLFDQLTDQEINEVYDNLDITVNETKEKNKIYPIISPKNYSSIFRSLYLSSFVTKEDSNYILNTLTKTIFKDKIPANIPDTIKIAHKIGVFDDINNTSQDLFIDCGIVYVPNRPYILCAFVEDTNEKAQEYISQISKMIYEYITTVKGGQ